VTHVTHFVNGYNGDISATAQVRMAHLTIFPSRMLRIVNHLMPRAGPIMPGITIV
jgi:hypothetical protein